MRFQPISAVLLFLSLSPSQMLLFQPKFKTSDFSLFYVCAIDFQKICLKRLNSSQNLKLAIPCCLSVCLLLTKDQSQSLPIRWDLKICKFRLFCRCDFKLNQLQLPIFLPKLQKAIPDFFAYVPFIHSISVANNTTLNEIQNPQFQPVTPVQLSFPVSQSQILLIQRKFKN